MRTHKAGSIDEQRVLQYSNMYIFFFFIPFIFVVFFLRREEKKRQGLLLALNVCFFQASGLS